MRPAKPVAQGRRSRALAAGLVALVMATPLATAAPEASRKRAVFGVEIEMVVRGLAPEAAAQALEDAFAEAERVASLIWLANETSEIGILNHVPMRIAIAIAPETVAALATAEAVADATGGAYDPTLPPLLDLWGIGTREARIPRQVDIDAALRSVYWQDLTLDSEEATVSRATRRTRVDLDELAIGEVLDRALARLRAAGANGARVSAPTLHAAFGAEWLIPLALPRLGDTAARAQERGESGSSRSSIAGSETPPGATAAPTTTPPATPPTAPPTSQPTTAPAAPAAPTELRSVVLHEGGLALVAPRVVLTAPDGTIVHDRIDARSGRPVVATRWVVITAPSAALAAGHAVGVFALGSEGRAYVESHDALEAVIAPAQGPIWSSAGIRSD